MNAAPDIRVGFWPVLYGLWTAVAISLAFAQGGLSDANLTRLGVLAFLALQIAFRRRLAGAFVGLAPRTRFVVYATLLAAVVEGLHMNSKPVFDSLRVTAGLPLTEGVRRYAIDLAFTVPAYVAIFGTIGWFIGRLRYALWPYVVIAGLAQALGDGGVVFFAGAPQLLAFLPYPMTNYHACNVIPFLAVRDGLAPTRRAGAQGLLLIPSVVAVYFVCGAAIKAAGRALGFEAG